MPPRSRKASAITILDVAREARVSSSTVSRVLNASAQVNNDKRERVLAAVSKLGFVANFQARSLVNARTQLIGLIVHDIGWQYAEEIVRGIDEELTALDYNLVLFTTHHDRDKEANYVRLMTQGLVDGLLLLVPIAVDIYRKELVEDRFPHVLIDQHSPDGRSTTVMARNWQGAQQATRYLLDLGHRRIGFISGDPELASAAERLRGYCATLAEAGVAFDPQLVEGGYFRYAGGLQAAQKLLDLPDRPTAIFAANDFSAIGAIEAIRDWGLSIPDDVSVIGFDDIPQARWLRPALTTVRQPLVEMGRRATRHLLGMLTANEDATDPASAEHVLLDTDLIIRESCQPPGARPSTKRKPHQPES